MFTELQISTIKYQLSAAISENTELRALQDFSTEGYINTLNNSTNWAEFMWRFMQLEMRIIQTINNKLNRLMPNLNNAETLHAQRENPALKEIINLDQLIGELNIIILNNFDLASLKEKYKDKDTYSCLESHQHNLFFNIGSIITHTFIEKKDDKSKILEKAFALSLLKIIFYNEKSLAFSDLLKTLEERINRKDKKFDLKLCYSEEENSQPNWNVTIDKDRITENEVEYYPVEEDPSTPLTQQESSFFRNKNKILAIAGIVKETQINEDFFARMLHMRPGKSAPVKITRNYPKKEGQTINDFAKTIFNGFILFNRDGKMGYYHSIFLKCHELAHACNYLLGNSKIFVSMDNTTRNLFRKIWGKIHEIEEFYVTLGHLKFSEYDLVKSSGLLLEPRIFYLQPIVFIAFMESENRTIEKLILLATKIFLPEEYAKDFVLKEEYLQEDPRKNEGKAGFLLSIIQYITSLQPTNKSDMLKAQRLITSLISELPEEISSEEVTYEFMHAIARLLQRPIHLIYENDEQPPIRIENPVYANNPVITIAFIESSKSDSGLTGSFVTLFEAATQLIPLKKTSSLPNLRTEDLDAPVPSLKRSNSNSNF